MLESTEYLLSFVDDICIGVFLATVLRVCVQSRYFIISTCTCMLWLLICYSCKVFENKNVSKVFFIKLYML